MLNHSQPIFDQNSRDATEKLNEKTKSKQQQAKILPNLIKNRVERESSPYNAVYMYPQYLQLPETLTREK